MESGKRLMMTALCFNLVALFGCAGTVPDRVSRERLDSIASHGSGTVQVQQSNPQPPEKHYQAARAALMEGNREKAELEVKLALQNNPLNGASHFLLGCLLEQKGEHDEAIVGFQRAVSLDPANPGALYNLGTMLLRRGEAVPASRLLESAVLISPDRVPYYNNLAMAYFLTGLPELAVASYEEVLRRDPYNIIALKNLLRLAKAAGFHDAAGTYRQRLDAAGSGRAARMIIDAGEPITLLPTWPLSVAAVSAPPPAPEPAMTGSALQLQPDMEVTALRDLLRDLPHVTVERRAGRITVSGWTGGTREKEMLARILSSRPEVLDLTSDDSGNPQRMIEIDAVLFILTSLDQQDEGFNFLKLINVNFNYFAADNNRPGTGYSAPPAVTGAVTGLAQQGWIFSASASYNVNIANASTERVAVLARPHLTAMSGTSARFLAGGELVYKVTGNIGGDIRPYPFGTTLLVIPTLLRTPAGDGTPRVHVRVEAGRTSVLSLLDQDPNQPTSFSKVTVASEAVLAIGQTLILSGLNQRESRTGRSGVPILKDIPILKYFFSTKTTVQSDTAVIILLTPRDPAFRDESHKKELAEFVEKRRAFIRAKHGTPEDMQRFKERYPDWDQLPPNRLASHFFLLENSELYRTASGQELTSEDLDLELLGPGPK